jgi:acetyltransferase-like isoleucine patch superfamily enzyme
MENITHYAGFLHSCLRKIAKHCRYTLPLWLVGLFTNWLPEHESVCTFRGWLARPFIGRCGKGFQLGSQVVILCSERLVVGKLVYIARGSWLNCFGGMTIDDQVILGPYVVISTAQYQFKDQSFRLGESISSPVSIGRGSWLGAHVSVKCGVKIGPGNLIAGNACVVKDTPANVMVGGVPAIIIRSQEDHLR